jgi:hypothetical protein
MDNVRHSINDVTNIFWIRAAWPLVPRVHDHSLHNVCSYAVLYHRGGSSSEIFKERTLNRLFYKIDACLEEEDNPPGCRKVRLGFFQPTVPQP